MFQILPFRAGSNLVLPNGNSLPVELWALILRFLDPASLLTAAGTSSYWSSVCKGDPVLKATVRRQMMVERERYLNEMLNPGLSIISNRRKIVQWRAPTVPQTPDGFFRAQDKKRGFGGPMRTKFRNQRSRPYQLLRC
ncbi:hypothetical protein GEV33_008653 [Tenebrio molitor]|uniref:F-box domain-containing protein n=1 Tax=Tenebrio molitor TaxID=7067 RepID=A0A8J6HGT3_TENMO|nr:hypothetical protein GEV33_008653 [Tenebrio molitor]